MREPLKKLYRLASYKYSGYKFKFNEPQWDVLEQVYIVSGAYIPIEEDSYPIFVDVRLFKNK